MHEDRFTNEQRKLFSRAAIAERIVIIRKHLKKSQIEFAELIGISVTMLQKVEATERGISSETAAKISLATGYSTDYLLLGKTGEVISPSTKDKIKEKLYEASQMLDEE